MDQIFDESGEIETMDGLLLPFRVNGFKQGIMQAVPKTVAVSDVFTLAVRKAIEAQALERAKLITGTTKDALKAKLKDAIDNGDSVQAFAKTIRDTFDAFGRNRSLSIARTEITSSVNYGATETLNAEGYQEKEWSTVMDGRERDSHAEADGQTVPIDEPFKLAGGDAMYPGDPSLPPEESVNCRCTTLGTGVPEERKAHVLRAYLRMHGAIERRLVVSLRREFERQGRRVLSHFPPQ